MIDLDINDTIFNNLNLYSLEIDEQMITDFKEMVSKEDFPDEVIIDITEGVFKINKLKKEFRILKRYHYDQEIYLGYPNEFQIDMQVFIAYKVAKLSGFNVFLEPKYSN
jgi:hypothetical protein